MIIPPSQSASDESIVTDLDEITLTDMDGDGQEELVVAAVLEKTTFKKSKSMIYVYELDGVRALSGKTSAPGIIESDL